MTERISRVNELLQREIGRLIVREAEIPGSAVTTVTRVDASPNLQQAKVYISVIPEDQRKDVLSYLKEHIFELQQQLNKRLHMRPVPKIIFVQEAGGDSVQRVEEILSKIQKEE